MKGGVFSAVGPVLLLLAPTTAFAPSLQRPAVIRNVGLVSPAQQAALAVAPLARTGKITAVAASPSVPFVKSVARVAMLCVSSLLVSLLRVGRAFAASRTATEAPSITSMLLTGGTLKYGGLAVVLGAMYVFRKEEKPILSETLVNGRPAPLVDLDAPVFADPKDQEAADAVNEASPNTVNSAPLDELPSEVPQDDSSIFSSLQGRMQQLAEERRRAEEEDTKTDSDTKSPMDSSDDWGTGSTAVLEPPGDGRGVFDGPPPVDFPPGFPLVDGEVTEREPAEAVSPSLASDSDVEMLKRMFGSQ